MFDIRKVSAYLDVQLNERDPSGLLDDTEVKYLAEELLDDVDNLLSGINYDWDEDPEDFKERLKELAR